MGVIGKFPQKGKLEKKAEFISVDCNFLDIVAAIENTKYKHYQLQVGESFLRLFVSSSNPLATKRALTFLDPFWYFSVIIQHEDIVFWFLKFKKKKLHKHHLYLNFTVIFVWHLQPPVIVPNHLSIELYF